MIGLSQDLSNENVFPDLFRKTNGIDDHMDIDGSHINELWAPWLLYRAISWARV